MSGASFSYAEPARPRSSATGASVIVNIQALRAAAALLVVFVHMAVFAELLGGGDRTLAFGNCGVDLFFVISGFIMMHSVMAQSSSAGAFLVNRVIRVVPLYWLTTLGLYAIAVIAPGLLGDTKANVAHLILSLAFVPFDRGGGVIEPLFFLGWTLNYEIFFYACFALGLGVTRGRPVPTMLFCAGLLLACVVAGWAMRSPGLLAAFYTNKIMLEFLFGMIAARLLTLEWAPPRWSAVAMVMLGLGFMVGAGQAIHAPRWAVLGLPATLAVLGAVWAERSGARASARLVQALGAASYALYLSHPFVMQVFDKLATRIDRPAATILLAVAGMLAAIAVAILVHRLIELPITHRLRRAAGHRRPVAERGDPLAEKERDNLVEAR